MGGKSRLRPAGSVGEALVAYAHDILAEARVALDNPSDAVAVHDFRKAMKRRRAFLRLLEPFVGVEANRQRITARDLARELAGARDGQAALDALGDVAKHSEELSPRSLATVTTRLEAIRESAEETTLTDATRARLRGALDEADAALAEWPMEDVSFPVIARGLSDGYGRVRKAIPEQWARADSEELHELRQRVVVHRYQMELVEPLWPRLGRVWVNEAQRLRERLGTCQDLAVLTRLAAPRQPLAPWRSRLTPLIEARHATHVDAAARLTTRMFAERPKAFRRRLEALWEQRHAGRD